MAGLLIKRSFISNTKTASPVAVWAATLMEKSYKHCLVDLLSGRARYNSFRVQQVNGDLSNLGCSYY